MASWQETALELYPGESISTTADLYKRLATDVVETEVTRYNALTSVVVAGDSLLEPSDIVASHASAKDQLAFTLGYRAQVEDSKAQSREQLDLLASKVTAERERKAAVLAQTTLNHEQFKEEQAQTLVDNYFANINRRS